MVAAQIDLTLEAGATFYVRLTYRNPSPDGGLTKGDPINVTGGKAALIVDATTTQTARTFASDDATPHVTVGGADGKIEIKLPPSITTPWAAARARYVVNFTDSAGDVHRLLQGRLLLSRQ